MAKLENTTDAAQVKQANFHKLFGDAPEMRDAASGETIRCFSGSRREPFHLFAVPREYPVCDFKNIPDILIEKALHLFRKSRGIFCISNCALDSRTGIGRHSFVL